MKNLPSNVKLVDVNNSKISVYTNDKNTEMSLIFLSGAGIAVLFMI